MSPELLGDQDKLYVVHVDGKRYVGFHFLDIVRKGGGIGMVVSACGPLAEALEGCQDVEVEVHARDEAPREMTPFKKLVAWGIVDETEGGVFEISLKEAIIDGVPLK